jgi:hypothetical protein
MNTGQRPPEIRHGADLSRRSLSFRSSTSRDRRSTSLLGGLSEEDRCWRSASRRTSKARTSRSKSSTSPRRAGRDGRSRRRSSSCSSSASIEPMFASCVSLLSIASSYYAMGRVHPRCSAAGAPRIARCRIRRQRRPPRFDFGILWSVGRDVISWRRRLILASRTATGEANAPRTGLRRRVPAPPRRTDADRPAERAASRRRANKCPRLARV